MDLKIIILSEVRPRKKYGITHMWNLIKNDTNKHIYLFICEKHPTDCENKLWLQKGKWQGGINQEFLD